MARQRHAKIIEMIKSHTIKSRNYKTESSSTIVPHGILGIQIIDTQIPEISIFQTFLFKSE